MLKNVAEVGAGMLPQNSEAISASAIAALQQRVNTIIDSEMLRLIQRIPTLDRNIRLEIAESLMQTTVALLRTPMTKVARQDDYPGRRNLVHSFAVLFDIKVEPQRPYRL